MKITGEDIDKGLRDWLNSELKEGPRQSYDLGKFFFTVSLGTSGAIAALEKLNAIPVMDFCMVASQLLLFASMLFVIIRMVMPKIDDLEKIKDIRQHYVDQVKTLQHNIWLWLVLWILGMIFGAIAVAK